MDDNLKAAAADAQKWLDEKVHDPAAFQSGIKVMAELNAIAYAKKRGREEREAARKQMREEYSKGTPRAQRAKHHAHSMINAMRDFIPEACMEDALEEMMLTFFQGDFEIVQVPPGRDEKEALELRQAMHKAATQPIVYSVQQGEPLASFIYPTPFKL